MRIRALLVVRFLCLLVCICICICICICGGVVPPHFQQERKAPDRSVARRFVHHEATKGGVVGPPVGSRDQKKGQHERPIHGARQVQDGSGSTGGRGAVRTGRCGVGHGTIKDGRVVVVIAGIRVVAGIRVGLRKGRGTGFVVDAQVRGWASVCQGCGGLPDPPVPIVFFFFGGCRCRCRCRRLVAGNRTRASDFCSVLVIEHSWSTSKSRKSPQDGTISRSTAVCVYVYVYVAVELVLLLF
mmetsp:Transcript_17869/g.37344  ORF Transcript_17869/g.37344 Transcript_17869/m.37344 type:complete len:242 (+) Transcript_17869:3815-4540(+)